MFSLAERGGDDPEKFTRVAFGRTMAAGLIVAAVSRSFPWSGRPLLRLSGWEARRPVVALGRFA